MATLHVSTSGSNTSPYETWAKAATSFGTAVSAASAGDTILVDSTHSEDLGGVDSTFSLSGTEVAPLYIVSAVNSSSAYSAGATLHQGAASNGSIGFTGSAYIWGMTFTSGSNDDFRCNDSTHGNMEYHDCTMTASRGWIWTSASVGARVVFNNCTANIANSESYANLNDNARIEIIDSTITDTSGAVKGLFTMGSGDAGIRISIRGSDLSTWDEILREYRRHSFLYVDQCLLKSGVTVSPTPTYPDCSYLVERSTGDTGGLTAPKLGLQEYGDYHGIIKGVTAQYRTGGANDGEQANEHSWEMASNANAAEFYKPLCTPWGARYVAGGSSITLTFYVASGGTLNDDDFWIELFSPDETATSTTQADFRTSRMANPQATPAALTTDSGSTWNGSGVGTKQQITFTFTPDIAGPVKFRACLAKPSTTVYFDPKVVVS